MDRTYIAIKRQLDAMACRDGYELGVLMPERRNADGEPYRAMAMYGWSKASEAPVEPLQLAKFKGQFLKMLKGKNHEGADIYIRPSSSSGAINRGLILIDDLTAESLQELCQEGFEPSLVTETSPDNFQAWVRLSKNDLSPALATQAAIQLADRFGGDPASADYRHFGRLAGFTNRKPHHRQPNGYYPFVTVTRAKSCLASKGQGLIDQCKEWIDAHGSMVTAEAIPELSEGDISNQVASPTLRRFEDLFHGIAKKFGGTSPDMSVRKRSQGYANLSKVDWMVAKQMLSDGVVPGDLKAAMLACSHRLSDRKPDPFRYVHLTVEKAALLINLKDK